VGVFGECSCSEGCAHYTLALHDGADAEGEAGGGKGALEVARKHGATLASVGEQKCVVFSPAGDLLVMGGADGTIRMFAWPEMNLIATVKDAHSKPITDLAFDAEATTLLSVSQERAAEASGAKWWTVEKTELGEKEQQGEMSREMNLKHKSYLWDQSKMAHLVGAHRGAATHADGLTFTGFNSSKRKGPDSYVVRWERGCASRVVVAHKEGKITALALAPNGCTLATGSSEGEVLTFETQRMRKTVRIANIHMVFVTTLSFSPDSSRLLSASGDTSAHVATVSEKVQGGTVQALPIFFILLIAAIAYLIQRYLQASGAM